MSRIKLMSIILLGALTQQAFAMNQLGNGLNQLKDQKEQKERDAFWQGQFSPNSKFKELDPRLQKSIAESFILPVAKAKVKQNKDKMYLPLAVKGLTPHRIETIEKELLKVYEGFKSTYIAHHKKEPNTLHLTVKAYANELGEIYDVDQDDLVKWSQYPSSDFDANINKRFNRLWNQADMEAGSIGKMRSVLYSDGSIVWVIDHNAHRLVNSLNAEKKILAQRLYEKSLKPLENVIEGCEAKMGRDQLLPRQYNALFLAYGLKAQQNYSGFHTQYLKDLRQWHRIGDFIGYAAVGLIAYRMLFKNRQYDLNNSKDGMIGMLGLTCIAGNLLIAAKAGLKWLVNI